MFIAPILKINRHPHFIRLLLSLKICVSGSIVVKKAISSILIKIFILNILNNFLLD